MNTLLVACGTNEGAVFALVHSHEAQIGTTCGQLKTVLLDMTAHNGNVSALAIDGPILVSGGSDEVIQVFSLTEQARLNSLEMHTGTIRHLEFARRLDETNTLHLTSTSDDGCIGMWRVDHDGKKLLTPSWECIRMLRRHKGPVTSLALHPSAKCAYSISEDKTFRIWSLTRGRQAYATRLKLIAPDAQTVQVSPSGNRLMFTWQDRFDLIDTLSNKGSASKDSVSCSLASVRFEQPLSASPVFFNEDDFENADSAAGPDFVHILAGTGAFLSAFRCQTTPCGKKTTSGAEPFGQVRLPGKRIKAIRVSTWPAELRKLDPSIYGFRCRLVVAVTTQLEGSHIGGYIVNLNQPLSSDKSVVPVFSHDINAVRLTTLAINWNRETFEASDEEMNE